MRGRGVTAREYLEGVASDVRAHRRAELLLTFGPASGGMRGGSGLTDPVQARFESDERARAAMARTEETIGEALARIDGLRTLFGRKADVLEMRYIDLAAWDEIAAELGVDKRKAHRWHDMVCDWVDSFGWARASRGYGTAQM